LYYLQIYFDINSLKKLKNREKLFKTKKNSKKMKSMAKPHKQTVTKYNYKKQKLHNNKQLDIIHLVPDSLLGGI